MPQLLSDPPLRPDADAGTVHKERYAAFTLGLLASDADVAALRAGDMEASLWDLLVMWEAQCTQGSDAGAVASAIQRNFDNFAQVHRTRTP